METEADTPQMIPAVELTGSHLDRVKAVDAAMRRLEHLRTTLTADMEPRVPLPEVYGPHINAPVWPWFVAGWVVCALFVVMFLLAWSWS